MGKVHISEDLKNKFEIPVCRIRKWFNTLGIKNYSFFFKMKYGKIIQIEEWKTKNPDLAKNQYAGIENVGFTKGRKPPTALIKSGFPTPVAPISDDDAKAEEQVAKEYDEAASKTVIYATEVDASGLGTALNTYQEFLHQEYELQDKPVAYSFTFDDEIGNSYVTESFFIDHTRKDNIKKDSNVHPSIKPKDIPKVKQTCII